MNLRKILQSSVALALVFAFSSMVLAQDYRGKIQGAITDESGAVIPGAKVVLHNDSTNVEVTANTNDEGRYKFDFIEPGNYSVIVEKDGFKKTNQPGLIIRIQGDLTVDLKLAIGDVAATVTVEDTPVAVQFNSSGTAITIENTTIDQMPVRGRNPYNITTLDPSVNGGEASENRPYHHAFANELDAGGGTTRANEVQLNGTALTSSYKVAYTPSVDAVQEVTFSRSAVDSEQGFSSGGTIALNMKSGTSKFHGAAYYYRRDPRFNANGDPTIPRFAGADETALRGTNLKMFGGNIGGPIIKKRVFFFSSFEKWKDARPISVRITVPTALERAGDFSQSLQPCTGGILCARRIYDPYTSTGSSGTRIQFLNNKIDPSRFDPVAVKLLAEIPLPNLPGNELNWQGTKTENVDYWNLSTRVDMNFSERLKTFVSYGQFRANLLESNPTDGLLFPRTGSNRYGLSLAADTVYTLNSKTVLNFRVGYHKLTDEAAVPDALLGTEGLTNLWGSNTFYSPIYTTDQIYYPALTVGADRLGRTGREFWQHPQGYNAALRLNTYFGNHSVKFGGEYRVDKGKGARFEPLNFGFRQQLTAGVAGPSSAQLLDQGNAWASFLLGVLEPTNNFVSRVPVQEVVGKGYAAYFMDDWKFNNNLTLNLGLRWEFEPGPVDAQNRVSLGPDFTKSIPEIAAAPPAISTALVSGINPSATVASLLAAKGYSPSYTGAWQFATADNRNIWDRSPWEFLPRLGFALKIDDKSVVRVGWARFIQPSARIRDPLGDFVTQYTGYSVTTNVLNPANGVPLATLSNPFPTSGAGLNPVLLPTEQNRGIYTAVGNTVGTSGAGNSLDEYNQKPPLNDKFTVSYQRGIWQRMIVTADYFFNYGTRLPYLVDINAFDPAYLYENARNTINLTIPNPFRNAFSSDIMPGPLRTASTIQLNQLLRPYPHYQSIWVANNDGRKSRVQSLKLQLQRPHYKGLSFMLSYAINHEETTEFFDDLATFNKQFSWRDTNAPRHRFTNVFTWDIPIGKGQWLLGDAPKVVDYILGGWKLTNSTRYYSGRKLSFSQSLIVNGNPILENPTNGQWFNTSVFSAVPTAATNVRRTSPWDFQGLYGPSTFQTDATMSKAFNIREGMKLEFRLEVYNLTNTINWDNPNTSFGNTNFGKVTAKRAQYVGREVQYGLRFVF